MKEEIEAPLQAEIERLRERCEAYKGQVEAGSHEIERLRSELGTALDRFKLIKEGGEGAERALRLAIPDILHALSLCAQAG